MTSYFFFTFWLTTPIQWHDVNRKIEWIRKMYAESAPMELKITRRMTMVKSRTWNNLSLPDRSPRQKKLKKYTMWWVSEQDGIDEKWTEKKNIFVSSHSNIGYFHCF